MVVVTGRLLGGDFGFAKPDISHRPIPMTCVGSLCGWVSRQGFFTMDRSFLGAQRVADPVTEAYRTLYAAVERKGWTDFNWDAVSYYYDRMICNWLLQLIDNALSDAQLEAVKPAEVHLIVLLLFRDLFRHHASLLRPSDTNGAWIEPLFQEIARELRVPAEGFQDDGQPYDLVDMKNCGWAKQLAAPFGLPPEKLSVCHSAIVTGVVEELGGGVPNGDTEPTPKRPWWRFW